MAQRKMAFHLVAQTVVYNSESGKWYPDPKDPELKPIATTLTREVAAKALDEFRVVRDQPETLVLQALPDLSVTEEEIDAKINQLENLVDIK